MGVKRLLRSDIAFTDAVKSAQEKRGSRELYAKMTEHRDWSSEIEKKLLDFIAERDSFYLGTANAQGQPYIQHRGGPKGFLKVLDARHLLCADYKGNRQYISLGNLSENSQACLFLMDYANQRRAKIWGNASFVEDDQALLDLANDPHYHARPERVLLFRVEAWDFNCRQHIVPRYTLEEIELLQGS